MAYLAYLDSEDEITSAAARIRNAPGDRIGLVLPFSSRVATSRINFRLLAREAEANGRILDIIAPEPAARALAASAGLAAYATVTDYEDAVGGGATGGPRWGDGSDAGQAGVPPHPDTGEWVQTQAEVGGVGGTRRRAPAETPDRQDWTAPGSTGTKSTFSDGPTRRTLAGAASTPVAPTPSAAPKVARRPRPMVPATVLGAILVAAVLIGVVAAAAAMLLPAAEITVVARTEALPAVTLEVVADPAVTSVDPVALRVPGLLLQVPVQASGQYPATGKKVTETKAAGSVRFQSANTYFAASIPQGTRVSTLDGVVFATTATTIVPKAVYNPKTKVLTVGTASVGIAAVTPGVAGNVAAGTITQVPASLTNEVVDVSNPAPTTGGTHTEAPQVVKADVDAALKDLQTKLAAAFQTQIAAPPGLPSGAVAYPTTAVLGTATPDTDPATLVGTPQDTFSLSMSATGTILAVDPGPISALGQAAVSRVVGKGYTVVPGSVVVQVGAGTPNAGTVGFAVQVTGQRVKQLDAAALQAEVLGRTAADARAVLEVDGTVTINLWPFWVNAVPSNASRVTLTVGAAAGAAPSEGPGAPSPSASPVPSG